jgi:cell division protein FtsB
MEVQHRKRLHLDMALKGKKLPNWFRNRYVLVVFGFLVYITFFDAHDLISQLSLKYQMWTLRSEIEYLDQNTAEATAQIEQLTSDDKLLEKFAREQHRMRRENEEVFVIIRDDD